MGSVQHPDILVDLVVEWARRLWLLFPCRQETEVGVKRVGCVTQPLLFALWVRQVWKMSAREGRGAPISLPAVLPVCCSIFRRWWLGVKGAVQSSHRTISQYQPAGRNSVSLLTLSISFSYTVFSVLRTTLLSLYH